MTVLNGQDTLEDAVCSAGELTETNPMMILRRSVLWLWFTALAGIAVAIPAFGPLTDVLPGRSWALLAGPLFVWIGGSVGCAAISAQLGPSSRLKSGLQKMLAGLARGASILFGLELMATGVRIAVSFVPALEKSAAAYIDPVFAPAWSLLENAAAGVNIPGAVGGVAVGPLLLFGLLLLLRNVLHWRLDLVRQVRHRDSTGARRASPVRGGEGTASDSRTRALATYANSRSLLETSEVELTFLSLDVVDAARLKEGEDPYLVDHAFRDYRKLVERSLERYGAYKQTWTPDGQMAAFQSPDTAVWCAREIISNLREFNERRAEISSPFRVRAGANVGVVFTDDQTPMERISDFSIDVAGHLQKHADPNSLWISGELHERLEDPADFEPVSQKVDDRDVYVWRGQE